VIGADEPLPPDISAKLGTGFVSFAIMWSKAGWRPEFDVAFKAPVEKINNAW
jgi:hypothetical protein